MQTIITAKDHLGTQLLLGLDADKAQIKGSMTPDRADESVQVKAELSGNSEEQHKFIEGKITDQGGKLSVYDSSHKFLEEISCDQKSCKRSGANGDVLTTRDISNPNKEVLVDKLKNSSVEFYDEFMFNGKEGKVFDAAHQEIGTASLKNRGELSNIIGTFTGADRTFHQTGAYHDKDESRALNITYKQNGKDEVSFSGTFERKD